MRRLEWYLLKQALSAFALSLAALTALVWVTQALRELDLVTLKGQALSIFFMLTGLLIPTLILAIAPVALLIAIVYTLNRLNSDSELVVLAASGISPARVARPFLVLAAVIACLSGVLSLHVAPQSMNRLRLLLTEVRADIINSVVRDGRFTQIEKGLTFHVREKAWDGSLLGVLVNDERDSARTMTYLADRAQVVELAQGTFLVMESGAIQRRDEGRPDATIIAFQSYAIDLSQFSAPDDAVFFKPRERSTWQLLDPDTSDPRYARVAGRIRSELHDRLSAPLYPLAFTALALAFLAAPRTNRQGQMTAMLALGLAVLMLRAAGFGLSSMVAHDASAIPLVYASPLVAIAGAFMLARRRRLDRAQAWAEDVATLWKGRFSGLVSRTLRLEGAE